MTLQVARVMLFYCDSVLFLSLTAGSFQSEWDSGTHWITTRCHKLKSICYDDAIAECFKDVGQGASVCSQFECPIMPGQFAVPTE
jgi:hypothetical protein